MKQTIIFVLYLKYKNKILQFMEAPLMVEATVRRDHNAITIYMCESCKSRNNWQAPLTVEATDRRDHNAINIYMCKSRTQVQWAWAPAETNNHFLCWICSTKTKICNLWKPPWRLKQQSGGITMRSLSTCANHARVGTIGNNDNEIQNPWSW